MTPENFCYWLQGRAELVSTPPTPEEWQSIREHLALVFVKLTNPVRQVQPVQPTVQRPLGERSWIEEMERMRTQQTTPPMLGYPQFTC